MAITVFFLLNLYTILHLSMKKLTSADINKKWNGSHFFEKAESYEVCLALKSNKTIQVPKIYLNEICHLG
jgi:hypothetical protein